MVKLSEKKEFVTRLTLKAYALIEKNLFEDFSIQELSEQLCVSKDYLKHEFHFPTGESIWQLVKRMRLEYAFGLVKHSDFSVSSIGELSGYQTKNSFSKAFQQYFNISATQVRHKFDLVLPHSTGSYSHKNSTTPDFATIQKTKLYPAHYYFIYYEPLSILKSQFVAFANSERPEAKLQDYEVQEVSVTLQKYNGLATVQELCKAWSEPMWISSTHVVSATAVGSNLVRAGFVISQRNYDRIKVLERLGFLERPFAGGNFLLKTTTHPLWYTGIESFQVLNEAVRQGYYSARTNDIFVKTNCVFGRTVSEILIAVQ